MKRNNFGKACFFILLGLIFALLPALAGGGESPENTSAQTAPGSPLQYQQGGLRARADLGRAGVGARAGIARETSSWRFETTGRAGFLNGRAAFGLDLAAGYAWSPDLGLWAKVATEFDRDARTYTNAFVNFGWRPHQDWLFRLTLDYLNKRVEVSDWDKAENLNQYGGGLEVAYRFSEAWNLSGFFSRYRVEGEEFGRIGTFEETSGEWYHYGYVSGGVRGGTRDEAGLGLSYTRDRFHFSLGSSGIWRVYEEMLGHGSQSMSSIAGWGGLGFSNLFASGVDLDASYRREFAGDGRQSWRVGLSRLFGPCRIGLYYQESANDLIATDRRWFLGVTLPLEDAPRQVEASHPDDTRHAPQAPRGPRFAAPWITVPVTGMTGPSLRIAEQVTRKTNTVNVKLSAVDENVALSEGVMTISGLPPLLELDRSISVPSGLANAFSVSPGATSCSIDLAKLPAPAECWGMLRQQDGNYTAVYLVTQHGSVSVVSEEHRGNIPASLAGKVVGHPDMMKDRPPTAAISGPDSLQVGDTGSFSGTHSSDDMLVVEYAWRIEGPGTVASVSGASLKVNATAEGTIKVLLKVKDNDGNWSTWVKKSVQVSPKPSPKEKAYLVLEPSVTGGVELVLKGGSYVRRHGCPGMLCNVSQAPYNLFIKGDTSDLPATIPVTVSWKRAPGAFSFHFGVNVPTGTIVVNVSKATGGVVAGGYHYGGWNPSTVGTVTFSAPGLDTTTVTYILSGNNP